MEHLTLAGLQRYIKGKDCRPDLKKGCFLKPAEAAGAVPAATVSERRPSRG